MYYYTPVKKIFVEISRTCKKDCYYCYNSKKGRKNIVPNLLNIIDSIKKLAGKNKKINITFSGGEPTNKIKEITEILLELKKYDYQVHPTIITNIENLNNSINSFILGFHPYIVLSYNNKNHILIEKLRQILPKKNIFVRFTITPENVDHIYEQIMKIIKKGYYIGISPAFGIRWSNQKLLELRNLYIALTKNKERELIYDFYKIDTVNDNNKGDMLCKSLKEPNAIDINGKIYPCHRAIYFPELNIQKSEFISKCKSCKAKLFCTPCIYKKIPGVGCKIRLAILPAYEILLNQRRTLMKKKIRITYKGKKFEIPETVLKKYSTPKKKETNKKDNRNFYELGESDCY